MMPLQKKLVRSDAVLLIKRVVVILLAVLAIGAVILSQGSHFYTDWLWFSSLDFGQVFWTMFAWEKALPAAVWLVFAVFFFLNIRMTRHAILQLLWRNPQMANVIKGSHLNLVFFAVSVLLGFLYAAGTSLFAMDAALFYNAVPFGTVDPIFGRDISFYMFQMPFYRFILGLVAAFLVPTIAAASAAYIVSGHISLDKFDLKGSGRAVGHLSVLVALFALTRAAGHFLDVYDVMFSSSGTVYGPGFTDLYIRVWVFRILGVLSLTFAAVVLLGGARRLRLAAGTAVLWLVFSIVGGGIVPGLVQSWYVEPSEFSREEEFIAYHIGMTREAFGLNEFTQREFRGDERLTMDIIEDNWATIDNIRLWDPRPLLLTYGQLQEMRLYYRFLDADIGRYLIDGQYRQVLLAARELDTTRIQNRTWINEHLQYTHGYGAVMSPVNEASRQGIPEFWLSDIPVRSSVDIQLEVPQIYFGERTNQYVITNTRADEFDYPMGDQNAFYRYTGNDGVPISNPLRRAAFALRFGTSRILLSSEIHNESRLLLNRNIHQRVQKIAPFLRFDNDPYLVIHDGRLVWIMDAYTRSSRYPYSQPLQNWGNYVRNSVKVVVDAYHGTVDFYSIGEDPLRDTYGAIFPGLFTPITEMDPALLAHIRYPEDMLAIQAQMYSTYHMQNTRVFYNREDVWAFANEMYANREQPVEPYHVITELPGESGQEMVLMLPFTPISRSNMVAWLAARSDAPNYGEVIVYSFPKDSLTLGPAQIEARIDQDSDISQQLSLWGQRGSQVIRGNLLVVPIAGGLLYVEPLYLQSEQSGMPQLQRVIAAHGDDLVMETTLVAALEALFDSEQYEARLPLEPSQWADLSGSAVDLYELGLQAERLYEQAAEALQSGDFAAFGEAWYQLEEVLQQWNQWME